MAANRRTLARLASQRAALNAIVDTRTRALAVAWARAWDEIAADLQDAVVDYVENPGTSALIRGRKARQALQVASQRLLVLHREAGMQISQDALRLIRRAARDQHDLILSQLPAEWDGLLRTDPRQMDAMARRVTERIVKLTGSLSPEADRRMRRELLRGLSVGDNPRTVARRILQRVRGIFDGGLARANVIARTEMLDAYRNAAQASQKQAKSTLAGWQWVATLGPRTCPSCIEKHGSLHSLDEPGPLDHHQGRCVRVPVTKSWAELGFPGISEPAPALKPGDGVRWFDSQDEATQRQVLGRNFDAYAEGRFPPSDWSVRRSSEGWRDAFHVGKPRSSAALAS